MSFLDPKDFMKGMFPDGQALDFLKEGKKGSQLTAVAILCNTDFDKQAELPACNHWLPGWLIPELGQDQASKLSERWRTEFEDSESARQLAMSDQLDFCMDDEVMISSLEMELERHKRRSANFKELLLDMEGHGIVCRDVIADGNCGVETLLWLQRPPASCEDVKQFFGSVRDAVRLGWKAKAASPAWRILWDHTCMGRAPPVHANHDAQGEQEQPQPEPEAVSTPPRQLNRAECPFTPDPVDQKKKKKLVACTQSPYDSAQGVKITIPEDAPPRKKLRTGVPGKIEVTINHSDYFEQSLSDRAVTYREFQAMHAEMMIVV